MAVWGADVDHEDDPERAVRAGLGDARTLAELRDDAGDGLAMRVGINTGPVYLGAVGTTTEFTAMGDTVNVASRRRGPRPVGGVLVTHDTYRHIRGVFDGGAARTAEVKGKDEPIPVYVVRAAQAARAPDRRPVASRASRPDDRPRASELAALLRGVRTVVAAGCRTASRSSVRPGSASRGCSTSSRTGSSCSPQRSYFFTGRALRNRAGVAVRADPRCRRRALRHARQRLRPPVADKLRRRVPAPLDADEADVVGHWLGFDLRASPAVQRLLGSELAVTARAHLFAVHRSLPRATHGWSLFLEDLHWADDESLIVRRRARRALPRRARSSSSASVDRRCSSARLGAWLSARHRTCSGTLGRRGTRELVHGAAAERGRRRYRTRSST